MNVMMKPARLLGSKPPHLRARRVTTAVGATHYSPAQNLVPRFQKITPHDSDDSLLPLTDIWLTDKEIKKARADLLISSARPNHFPSREPFMDISPSLKHWSVQTHIFPAASPRACPESLHFADEEALCIYRRLLQSFSPSDTNARENAQRTVEQFMALSEGARRRTDSHWISPKNKKPNLFIAANRYFRKPTAKKSAKQQEVADVPLLTLVFTHANGMHKESWEPAMAQLLLSSELEGKVHEIWSIDAVGHGDSAFINRHVLGGLQDWEDHGRDILHFVKSYLPEASFGCDIPELLPQLPVSTSSLSGANSASKYHTFGSLLPFNSWRGRKIVVLGQSFSGCGAAIAVSAEPQLFHGAMLCDPALFPAEFDHRALFFPYVLATLRRRDSWPDREVAKSSFLTKPFFKQWDPATLDRYLHCALVEEERFEDPTKFSRRTVSLKCTRLQEAAIFAESFWRSKQTVKRLEELAYMGNRNHISSFPKLRFLWARENTSIVPEPQLFDLMTRLNKPFTSNRMQVGGHLFVQQAPVAFVDELKDFLKSL